MTLTPWVTPADLPANLPAVPRGDAEVQEVCDMASGVLYALSGRRWAGHATRTISVFASHTPWWWRRADLGLVWDASWGVCGWGSGPVALPMLVGGQIFNHTGCDRPRSIRLPDYPVRAIDSVTFAGAVRDPTTYRLEGSRFLVDVGWEGWPTCGLTDDQVMTVAYQYGADPPAAGKSAAIRLASELIKAHASQPSALPGYILQRVRQATTETYVRTDMLFDKGRTGLADVDLWLVSVNPSGLKRRSRTWSPDTDPRYTTTGGTTP